MRIQDIIRGMLDLIDGAEPEHKTIMPSSQSASPLTYANHGDDINRFKQIVDLIDNPERSEYCNEPNQAYSNLDSVTIHAGGGLNGPKHPADIRVKDPSATPHLIDTDVEPSEPSHPEHFLLIKSLRGL